MIFLVIIFFVVAVVSTLIYIDNTNVKKIEDFLMHQNCKTIDYSKGKYQAICSQKVIVVDNAFKVDLKQAKTLYYKTLTDIEIKKRVLILKSNQDLKLEFKNEASQKDFLKKLEEQRKK